MDYKKQFADVLYDALKQQLSKELIVQKIERPKQMEYGDYAFPCFDLAKIMKKSPKLIAQEVVTNLYSPLFEKVEAVGAYINVFLNKQQVATEVINTIMTEGKNYGNINLGNKGVVTIDLSSPNIAKPFSMGHLRSTVIGNSISLLLEKAGYQTIKINHLGDWGTQFGKLIAAYKRWGNEKKVKQDTIKELLRLYIQFHEEAETDPILEQEGRAWFKQLEEGNEEAVELWQWFRAESLKEFNRIYELLGITFDSTNGEAFYNDKMDRVVAILKEKDLLNESDGALVVDLQANNLPPCLIQKSDGATLYATRDLAAALYRQENYNFVKSLYVVGNEQSLHFDQLIEVLKKMDYSWATGIHHIPFGMMLKDGKKMSTRKGKVILLEEVLTKATWLAKVTIQEKNPKIIDKETTAKAVGVGAVIFHDLKNHRKNDVEFSLEDMLRPEGETGPYVQYTYARACSLLDKGQYQKQIANTMILDEEAWPVITNLMQFPEVVTRAVINYDPSQIAKYVIDLAQSFNKYYGNVKILADDETKSSRLSLVYAVSTVLKEGLRLLGLQAPEQM